MAQSFSAQHVAVPDAEILILAVSVKNVHCAKVMVAKQQKDARA